MALTNVSTNICMMNVSSRAFEKPPVIEACLSAIGAFVDSSIVGLVIIDKQAQKLNNNLLFINLLSSYSVFNITVFISFLVQIDIIDYAALAVIVSVLALCIITIDRVITIKLPFRYKSQRTWMICLEIATCWIVPVLYYIVQWTLVGPKLEYRALMLICVPIAGATVLLIANSLLFVVGRTQLKKILKTTGHITDKRARFISHTSQNSSLFSTKVHSTVSDDSLRYSKVIAKLKKELQLMYSCFEMVILFSVSWLPMSLYLLFTMESLHGMMPGYTYLLRLPVYLNAIITPLVYILRCRKLRRAICRRWCFPYKRRMSGGL